MRNVLVTVVDKGNLLPAKQLKNGGYQITLSGLLLVLDDDVFHKDFEVCTYDGSLYAYSKTAVEVLFRLGNSPDSAYRALNHISGIIHPNEQDLLVPLSEDRFARCTPGDYIRSVSDDRYEVITYFAFRPRYITICPRTDVA